MKVFNKKNLLWTTLVVTVIMFQLGVARDVLVQIKDIEPEEMKLAGFVLDNEQEIAIEAIGTHRHSRHWIATSAWILKADDRELVWELTDANSKWHSRKLREYRDKVTLPAGTYEVYFSYFPAAYYEGGWSFSRFFFRGRDDDYYDDVYEDFEITVRGKGKKLSSKDVERIHQDLKKKALVSLTVRREEEYVNQGFRLKKPTDLVIYTVGEARDDGSFDYGWILNTETRERVWSFDYRGSDYAGGSEKNRMLREKITLPAGNYAAFYVTDDSHNPREWNAAPPYDPAFWGLSLYLKNESDKGNVQLYDYEDIPVKNVIVDFSRMRDDAYMSKGFTLKKNRKVRIYALGEGIDGEMYDYGWIVNAQTHQRVWEMDYRNTEHAGGNRKNRMVDEIIELKKGDYLAYYVTDDSHSYRHWNASPPFDPERWGMTIIGADEDFTPGDVEEYQEREDKNILAKITEVRDSETRQEKFTLKKDGEVRIYAIGEGQNGRMYDYAWIENAQTGKVVWEMTYRKTDHAGGARKNREFNDTVYLKAGDYVLFYETDDSHSFREWNAAPPRDPVNYGVTVYAVK